MKNITTQAKILYGMLGIVLLVISFIISKKISSINDTKHLTPVEYAKKHNN